MKNTQTFDLAWRIQEHGGIKKNMAGDEIKGIQLIDASLIILTTIQKLQNLQPTEIIWPLKRTYILYASTNKDTDAADSLNA